MLESKKNLLSIREKELNWGNKSYVGFSSWHIQVLLNLRDRRDRTPGGKKNHFIVLDI